jgi:hypothetical protein
LLPRENWHVTISNVLRDRIANGLVAYAIPLFRSGDAADQLRSSVLRLLSNKVSFAWRRRGD